MVRVSKSPRAGGNQPTKQEPFYISTSEELKANYKRGREMVLFHHYMHQRASGNLYPLFRINRYELELLCSLSIHLAVKGRQVSSKITFFDSLTGNTRRKAKYDGYLLGLTSKGFINRYELRNQPGTLSLGITPLGWSVINRYLDSLEGLICAHPQKSGIDTIILPSMDHRPERYNLIYASSVL